MCSGGKINGFISSRYWPENKVSKRNRVENFLEKIV